MLSMSKGVGRPSLGVTKKVSITLPDWAWKELEKMEEEHDFASRSALLRRILLDSAVENANRSVSRGTLSK